MQILAVSDQIHDALYEPGVRDLCPNVDLIVSCGDLPYAYLEYIQTLLNAPLVYVLGNHDRVIYAEGGERVSGPEGGRNLDGRVVSIRMRGARTLLVAGLEGSRYYGGAAHQYTEGQIRGKILRMVPRLIWNRLVHGRAVDLIVSHAAPRGIHDGPDPCHRGFSSFLRLMRWARPKLWVHGHVHASYGYDVKPVTVYRTRVINAFEYQLLEFDDA